MLNQAPTPAFHASRLLAEPYVVGQDVMKLLYQNTLLLSAGQGKQHTGVANRERDIYYCSDSDEEQIEFISPKKAWSSDSISSPNFV
jgi:hypothetical protein